MALIKPQFVSVDAEAIISEMVADYEARTGKKLAPAQVERLLINAFAYREYLLRTAINETGLQNLVEFSTFPALDYLGQLLGVTRLAASRAKTTLTFNLVPGHTGILIPEGIRVQSIDGKAIFITVEPKTVATGVLATAILAECTLDGVIGNGYEIGHVSVILDPQPYISTAVNATATAGGADEESDEALRDRIKLAPASFSNAGSKGAYEFFAKSAHPSIIDVAITSPDPGDVKIFPLLEGGEIPSTEIIDAVKAACNPDKRRPLSDTVYVEAPTKIDYAIEVDLILLSDALQTNIVNEVTDNLQAYANERKRRLGVDVVINQIIKQANIEGVYKATVTAPESDIVVDENEFSNCTSITVNVTGSSDE